VGLKPKDPDQPLLAGGASFPRGDAATRVNDQGYITSVAWSPTLETHIGLGFL
jgi:glycine cleavage system aminomethyltransferase T